MDKLFFLDLRLFDGEGGDDGAQGGAPAPSDGAKDQGPKDKFANVVFGKQAASEGTTDPATAKTPEASAVSIAEIDRDGEFEALIKGDYKQQFDARVQKIINSRFRDTKALESQVESSKPVLSILAQKYGVDGDDSAALLKAIEEDDSYYEAEAEKRGLTVQQLKEWNRMERENAELKEIREERERRTQADRIYAQWMQQAESMKQQFPGFDFRTECSHPATGERFMSMLRSGCPVDLAYKSIHMDEIMGGAMQYTAKAVAEKTVNDIKARGMRPAENGSSGIAPARIVKSDPSTWTKDELAEVQKRVMRGETINL